MEAPDRHAPLLRPNFEAGAVLIWTLVTGLGILGTVEAGLSGAAPRILPILTGLLILRWAPAALRRHRASGRLSRSELRYLRPEEISDWVRHHAGDLLLGDGFDWHLQHAGWAHELLTSGDATRETGRCSWIHNLSEKTRDIIQPLRDTAGHTLIIGTTGSGKTRCFDLLITQAILRGEAVIILDPKGDPDLLENARRASDLAARSRAFWMFHPAFPKDSIRLDPLGSFNRPSELSGRIAGAMPGHGPGDPFRAFGQRALDQIIQGFLFTGTRPTLVNIRRMLETGIEPLLEQALMRHFRQIEGPRWRIALKGTMAAKPGPLSLTTLIRHYRETVKRTAPHGVLDGLLSFHEHDRVHFMKMVASLLPVLTLLTTGPLESLISPDPEDLDDPRPIRDLAGILERGEILYVGLDALSDGQSAAMLGSILLSDLAACAGERYNRPGPPKPVQVFIDEASEAVNEAAIQLLNKGRGAGFRLTLATQTLADFTARLGNVARAYQILGNVNTLIAFRVTDPDTQEYVTGNLPATRQKRIQRSQGLSTVAKDPLELTQTLSKQLIEEKGERFPPELLGQLPDLHYLGKLAGGRIVKGRIPILGDPTP